MTTIFSRLSPDLHIWILLLLILVATMLMWRLAVIGKPLSIKGAAPWGIVSIELAWTTKKARQIVDAWNERGHLETSRQQTHLDFLFLLIYPLALSLACAMLAGTGSGLMTTVGIALSWFVLLCTPLDAIENVLILRMLKGNAGFPIPLLTSLSAALKFALIVVALGYIGYAGVTNIL
ncbi:MAG: hypothetical protein OQK66_09895 [Prosthecochloris sp.]|uniref:hypothetical protein n=1 Tax=Prosthecochloris sp. TaxID=290513 RepID=UPI0025867960|nr:hypothetical protein [Prosthecochloris sp.]MCW8799264.1 hypothetical protein [Prosthecochloris sp.]